MRLSKLVRLPLLQLVLLLPIPVLVCVLMHTGGFRFLEDKLVDWRFLYRGELTSQAKVIYVDIDSTSLSEIGGWPWSRAHFASVCGALLHEGGVRAIGIDLVLSDLGSAEIADRTKTVTGNLAFLKLLQEYRNQECPVLLGASFSATQFRDIEDFERVRQLPLLARERRALADIEAPEGPVFFRDLTGTRLQPGAALIDTLRGATREVPLFAPTNVQVYQHMSLELARRALGVSADGVRMLPSGDPLSSLGDERHPLRTTPIEALSLRRQDGTELLRIPLRARQILEVNWHSAWLSPLNARESFSRVAANAEMLHSGDPVQESKAREFFSQDEFKDAIVLIGPTDTLLQDLGPCAFDSEPVPRVGIHGNLVKTLLSGRFLHRLPEAGGLAWWDFAVVLSTSLAMTLLAMKRGRRSLTLKLSTVLLGTLYVYVAFEVFRRFDLILPVAPPVLAGFLCSFGVLVWQSIEEERQKSRIRGMFGAYLSPTVVEGLIDSGRQPELGGHDAEITAYFSDIQGFSALSEVLESSRLVSLLNEYLSTCTEIVQNEGGTLDKYIGDALVAMYGAPMPLADHAYRACRSALKVQEALDALRSRWRNGYQRWPVQVHGLRARVGLNTGLCMIGNMGSRSRFNYTMMGDNVNLASRMEGSARNLGVETMCTEATRLACEQHAPGGIIFRPLGRIVVLGRSKPVPVHEIVCFGPGASPRTLECVDLFTRGLACMGGRDWDGARDYFQRSALLEPIQAGGTSGAFTNASLTRLERLAHYESNPPPPDWDGVEVLTEK
jgi:adenylate cyclase